MKTWIIVALTFFFLSAGLCRAVEQGGEVITAAEIKVMGVNKVVDVLNRLPGINASDNSVSIRGSVKVKVFLDGRSLNDRLSHYGGVNFDLVTMENVATITIIRGKGALQYGDDASGGVILIKSRRSMIGGGNVKGWAGNGDTNFVQANGHGQLDSWDYGVTLGHSDTAGFTVNNDHRKRQAGSRVSYRQDGNLIGITVDLADEKYGLPGRAEFPSPHYRKKKKMTAVSIPMVWHGGEANSFYTYSRQENRDASRGLDSFIKVREAGGDLKNNSLTSFGKWQYGVDWKWGEAASSRFSDKAESAVAAFIRHGNAWPGLPLTSTVGLRLSIYSEFDNTANPEVKFAWQQEDWSVDISYSLAHNTPSFYKRYDHTPTREPNPDLAMEKSDNFNLGWSFEKWSLARLSGAFFYNLLTDKISFVLGENGVGRYENFGRVVRKGAELQLSTVPWHHFDFSLSYTWLRATDETSGNTLTSSPEHRARAYLRWRHSKIFAQSEVVYTSRQYTRSDNIESIPEIFLLNIRGEYGFALVELFSEIKNVTDHNYINSIGYQGDPRTWIVGLNYRF